tara:strand:- start:6508 stop:6885 length:378 start_codon:yes stop_codon:yes gene_type:complete
MVTSFNKKDIVEFGNYILSKERKNRTSEINQENITHADIENWLEIKKNRGNIPVLAKFQVVGVLRNDEYENTSVDLVPVIDGSEENKSFSKYTPSGQINICVSDETDAVDYFEEGKEYFVKFTKA